MKELAQTAGFGIFHLSLAHLLQNGEGLVLDDGQFVEQGTVEYDIGIRLEGDDPLFLASRDTGQSADGLKS